VDGLTVFGVFRDGLFDGAPSATHFADTPVLPFNAKPFA
jgi:hypothetical protein